MSHFIDTAYATLRMEYHKVWCAYWDIEMSRHDDFDDEHPPIRGNTAGGRSPGAHASSRATPAASRGAHTTHHSHTTQRSAAHHASANAALPMAGMGAMGMMGAALHQDAGGDAGEPSLREGLKQSFSADEIQKRMKAAMQNNDDSVFDDVGMEVNKEKDTVKFLGMFELPRRSAAIAMSLWGLALQPITTFVHTRGYQLTNHLLKNYVGVANEASLHKASTAASMGMVGGLLLWGDIKNFALVHKDYSKKLWKLSTELAPVLDDMRGGHAVWNLMSVSEEDNEVIFAARARLAKEMQHERSNVLLQAIANAPTALARFLEDPRAALAQSGVVADGKTPAAANIDVSALQNQNFMGMAPTQLLGYGQAIMPEFIMPMVEDSRKEFQKTMPKVTALEMISSLNQQLTHNPDVRTFEVPKTKQNFSLTEYVMAVFRQHEEDMKALGTEGRDGIGERLKEPLRKAADQIAKAMEEGDMSPLGLICLVGEGKIVRAGGKAIARSEDIAREIARVGQHFTANSAKTDKKEYFANASFNLNQLKHIFGVLKGEEKAVFASIFPDTILEEAGWKLEEVKQMRRDTHRDYHAVLAHVVEGLAAFAGKLEESNVTKEEVAQLKKAAAAIREGGVESAREFKAKPGKDGIEAVAANALVSLMQHMGTITPRDILKAGRAELEKSASPTDKGDSAGSTNKEAVLDIDAPDHTRDAALEEGELTAKASHASRELTRRSSHAPDAHHTKA